MKRIFILTLVCFAVGYLAYSNLFINAYHLPLPAVSDASVHYSTVLWLQNESTGCWGWDTDNTTYPYLLWHNIIAEIDNNNGIPLPWTITFFNLAVMLGIFIFIYLIAREFDKRMAPYIALTAFGVSGTFLRESWLMFAVFFLGVYSLWMFMKSSPSLGRLAMSRKNPKKIIWFFIAVALIAIGAECFHRYGSLFVLIWIPLLCAKNKPQRNMILQSIIILLLVGAMSLMSIHESDGVRIVTFAYLLLGFLLIPLIRYGLNRLRVPNLFRSLIYLTLIFAIIISNVSLSAYLAVPHEVEFLDILGSYDRGELTPDRYVALYDLEVENSKGRGYGCHYLVSYTRGRVEFVEKSPTYMPVVRATGGFVAWEKE